VGSVLSARSLLPNSTAAAIVALPFTRSASVARRHVYRRERLTRWLLVACFLAVIAHSSLCRSWSSRAAWIAPAQHDELVSPSNRRKFLTASGAATLFTGANAASAEDSGFGRRKEEEPAFVMRTTKKSPRVPKVLGVLLLRTTYETVVDWGAYPDMQIFQSKFMRTRGEGFQTFKKRHENYDLTDLYNTSSLQETGGGVTNRFYFSYLNGAQYKTIGQTIRSQRDRVRFTRLVGERIYRRTVNGFLLKADDTGDNEIAGLNTTIGAWPKIQPPLPVGNTAADIGRGVDQLLSYLCKQKYCEGFKRSDIDAKKDGTLTFRTFVDDPVNLEATTELMKINEDFVPRFDQRLLQAYFDDRGYDSELTDVLADGLDGTPSAKTGVRSEWKLKVEAES